MNGIGGIYISDTNNILLFNNTINNNNGYGLAAGIAILGS